MSGRYSHCYSPYSLGGNNMLYVSRTQSLLISLRMYPGCISSVLPKQATRVWFQDKSGKMVVSGEPCRFEKKGCNFCLPSTHFGKLYDYVHSWLDKTYNFEFNDLCCQLSKIHNLLTMCTQFPKLEAKFNDIHYGEPIITSMIPWVQWQMDEKIGSSYSMWWMPIAA